MKRANANKDNWNDIGHEEYENVVTRSVERKRYHKDIRVLFFLCNIFEKITIAKDVRKGGFCLRTQNERKNKTKLRS